MFFEENVRDILSVVAGVLTLLGFIPYVYGLITDPKADPRPSTWFVWGFLDTIGLVGMIQKKTANGQIWISVIGAWLVFGLSLKYGKGKWNWLDTACLTGGAIGILCWWWFASATYGIVISMSVIVLGSIPTIISAFKDPAHENRIGWMCWFGACVASVLAIPAWTLDAAMQPFSFLLIESIMFTLVWIVPMFRKKGPELIHE